MRFFCSPSLSLPLSLVPLCQADRAHARARALTHKSHTLKPRCAPTRTTPHASTPSRPNHTTPTPSYYKLLLKLEWQPDARYPQLQYRDAGGSLMMLPSDLVLVQDKS